MKILPYYFERKFEECVWEILRDFARALHLALAELGTRKYSLHFRMFPGFYESQLAGLFA